ncbi:MAG: c-type cytochrome [Burkholderiales bacterium]
MSPNRIALAACAAVLAVTGCEREKRDLAQPPSAATTTRTVAMNELVKGGAPSQLANPYDENAQAVADGKRLFRWYNCNGCHANGGGDKGPALMDDEWLYGGEPANIVASILQGRPNGMPSFQGRIPDYQVWQIAAYVRSLSGQVRKDVAPSRNDALQSAPAENRVPTEPANPVNAPTR